MVGLVISQLGETFSSKRMDFFPAPIFTAMVTFADPQAIERCVCMNKAKTALVLKSQHWRTYPSVYKKVILIIYKLMLI